MDLTKEHIECSTCCHTASSMPAGAGAFPTSHGPETGGVDGVDGVDGCGSCAGARAMAEPGDLPSGYLT